MNAKVFIAMRYWHPLCDEAAPAVKAWGPDGSSCCRSDPQFSITTTDSSVGAWDRARRARRARGADARPSAATGGRGVRPGSALQPWTARPEPLPAAGYAFSSPPMACRSRSSPRVIPIRGRWSARPRPLPPGSQMPAEIGDPAHLLPEPGRSARLDRSVDRRGDPPRRRRGVPVVVAPIAFVSEHSETLVELEIATIAARRCGGVRPDCRAPTPCGTLDFIEALARLVAGPPAGPGAISRRGGRLCRGMVGMSRRCGKGVRGCSISGSRHCTSCAVVAWMAGLFICRGSSSITPTRRPGQQGRPTFQGDGASSASLGHHEPPAWSSR